VIIFSPPSYPILSAYLLYNLFFFGLCSFSDLLSVVSAIVFADSYISMTF